MRFSSIMKIFGCTLACLLAVEVQAQTLPTPRITHVAPPGGQAGSTFEVTVTGADLNDAEGLHFNFPGAKVEVASVPMVVAKDPKQKQPAMKTGPLTAQKFKVTLPESAPIGIHDLRLVAKGGVSNPRAFVVGDLKEFVEQEPNDDAAKPQTIELNSTVSGVVANPTDVDYYGFTGKKGQRVVASCLTTSIDSKLPAFVQIFNQAGSQELASGRNYRDNDALADCVLPADGDYYVRVSSFAHTLGGPDYFYRLSVSTAPWIDAVFPIAVPPGKETKVTVYGRNLPDGVLDPAPTADGQPLEKITMTIKAPGDERDAQRLRYAGLVPPHASALDGFPLQLSNPSGRSLPFLVALAQAPVVLDGDDNNTVEKAQTIPIPCEIAGRIEKKNDRDWFQFEAKKGQVLSIEVFGERLGSPMDLYFILQNAKGQTLTEQDDNPEVLASQFFTRNDDPPRYRFTAPADGPYFLMIASRDAFTQFGPRHTYLARITAEQPDFRLVAMPVNPLQPDSVVIGQNGHQAYNLFVWRLGGFTGDITLSGENLPPGISVRPQILGGNQKQGVVLVSAGNDAAPWVGGLNLLGTATVGGEKLVREVRSATVTWPVPQANLPTITRLDRELVLAIRDRAPYSLSVDTAHVSVLQGDKITIPVKLTPGDNFKSTVTVTALTLPAGLTSQAVTLAPGKETGNLVIDAKGPGTPGNFTVILRGQTIPPNPKQPQPPKGGGPVNLVQHATPVQLTIIPKTLAKLTLPQGNTKIVPGKQAEIAVKVARQFDYAGPFQVEATLPNDVKGLTLSATSIKAGEDEAKLIVRADDGAKIGANGTVTIRVIAMFNGTPVVHEGKATVTIGK